MNFFWDLLLEFFLGRELFQESILSNPLRMEQGTLRACRSLGNWKDLEISVREILILENQEKSHKLEWNPETTEVPLLW